MPDRHDPCCQRPRAIVDHCRGVGGRVRRLHPATTLRRRHPKCCRRPRQARCGIHPKEQAALTTRERGYAAQALAPAATGVPSTHASNAFGTGLSLSCHTAGSASEAAPPTTGRTSCAPNDARSPSTATTASGSGCGTQQRLNTACVLVALWRSGPLQACQSRRLRSSSLIAGTTSCMSPTTAYVALVIIGASASVLIAMITLELAHPAQCWMAPLMPHGM